MDFVDADQLVEDRPIEGPVCPVGGAVELNPGQERALAVMGKKQTHTLLVGGSRSGKTALITRGMITRALRAPNSRHLFVRHRLNALRASVWLDTMPKVLRMWFPGLHFKSSRQDGFEELPNGSQLWFGGLDDAERVEKILGQEYATIYAGECSQVSYSSIVVLRTRLAQPGTGLTLRGFYDLNPTSTQHWTYSEFFEHINPISRTKQPDPHNYVACYINPEDNADNLDPTYVEALKNQPEQFRARFYEGKYVTEIEGALWTAESFELNRDDPIEPDDAGKKLKEFTRIAIGVDPSGAQSKLDIKSDEIGIVVAGKKHGNEAVILEDASVRGGPKDWGRKVAAMYGKWKADVVYAEANYGGAMVESTIQAVDPNCNVELVTASRGKIVRAEPVAALYDTGKIKHAGRFNLLEEQLCLFSREGYKGDRSPDRADAAVWAISGLMFGEQSSYTLDGIR